MYNADSTSLFAIILEGALENTRWGGNSKRILGNKGPLSNARFLYNTFQFKKSIQYRFCTGTCYGINVLSNNSNQIKFTISFTYNHVEKKTFLDDITFC